MAHFEESASRPSVWIRTPILQNLGAIWQSNDCKSEIWACSRDNYQEIACLHTGSKDNE
jgi:hypothetical protein